MNFRQPLPQLPASNQLFDPFYLTDSILSETLLNWKWKQVFVTLFVIHII